MKRLQDLKITLDILAETGIGKTVNCFRKHEIAGDLAKALVNQWKKLVPKETNSSSLAQDDHTPEKQESSKKKEKGDFLKEKTSSNISEKRHSTGQDKRGFEKSEFVPKEMSKTVNTKTLNNQASEGHKDEDQHLDSGKHCPTSGNTEESNGDLEDCGDKKPSRSTKAPHNPPPEKKAPIHVDKEKYDHKRTNKEPPSFNSITEEMYSSSKSFVKKDKKSTDVANDDHVKHDRKSTQSTENRSAALGDLEMDKAKSRKSVKFIEKEKSGDGDFEEPTMSFETCLNYDLGPTFKKRKKPSEIQKLTKKHKNDGKTESLGKKVSEKDKSMTEKKNIKSKNSPKKVESGSIMDLLNVPLPSFLPDCFLFPSPYIENKSRQVKRAFIHSVAKPPREVRRKQEIYGTAGSTAQPHSVDKMKISSVKTPESKARHSSSDVQMSISSAGPSQDPKKMAKIQVLQMAGLVQNMGFELIQPASTDPSGENKLG
ncbi:Transcription elongation factor B polypeptide 3 [Acipenser ruthenus]|uniref:Transcription elongation factor B polypeptide 3 n=1 Tax=Acipenser ruthenus TaxID=7906 RepID=A0A444UD60_ACIRT|nr:Transcription elongation factor B polypeptide 3 [Acipenser ruthenus]